MSKRRTAAEIQAANKRRATAHAYRLRTVYGISIDEYWLIYKAQRGLCYICRRANGSTKRLATDHDHELYAKLIRAGWEHLKAMRASIRGLLCGICNKELGHARDQTSHFERCIEYLNYPPAFYIIKEPRYASPEAQGVDQQPEAEASGGTVGDTKADGA
jgi:hypothetical protein